MRIVICDSAQDATARTAARLVTQVQAKPDSVLGLATGGTMEAVYPHLVAAHRGGLSFANVTSFNLDEYVGLGPDHPQSYAHYMRHHLFDHVDLAPCRCFLPDGLAAPKKASDAYEEQIHARGPIDLQLLGLGHNGHIGFNEPGSSLTSLTREKALSHKTIAANSRFFGSDEAMPHSAVTMGIGTINRGQSIVLLALGDGKAEAVRAMVEGPVSAFCPASALQMHRDVTVFLDPAAAAQLQLREHYLHAETIQRRREAERQP